MPACHMTSVEKLVFHVLGQYLPRSQHCIPLPGKLDKTIAPKLYVIAVIITFLAATKK